VREEEIARLAAVLEDQRRQPEVFPRPQLPLLEQRPHLLPSRRIVFLDLRRVGLE
jgi:hypothetical protein